MNKIQHLHCLLTEYKPELIFVTETWLNSKILDSELLHNFPYSIIRRDRNYKLGGGVCVFIRNLIPIEEFSCTRVGMLFDIIYFEAQHPSGIKHRFLLVYRPPRSTSSHDDVLLSIIRDLSSSDPSTFTILGDLNLPIDWATLTSTSPTGRLFLAAFESLSLKQFVTFPTRLERILDVILSASDTMINVHLLPPLASSDHNTVLFTLHFPPSQRLEYPFRDFKSVDRNLIESRLRKLDWLTIFSGYSDIDDLYNRFSITIHDIIDRLVPVKRANSFAGYPSHITNLAEQRCRIFCETMSINDTKYTDISKKLDRHIKRYMANKVKRLASTRYSGGLFSFVGKIKNQSCIKPILSDGLGNRYVTDLQKSEAFADYFSSIFTPSVESQPNFSFHSTDSLDFPQVSFHEVYRLLRGLRASQSVTADGIPQIFFKMFAKYLTEPLTHIFNISLMMAQVPAVWKTAFITPIPKMNGASYISEFRPISILPTPLKILEEILKKHLLEWLEKVNCIPHSQHGFLPGASTCTLLMDSIHSWTKAINTGKHVAVVYFDLSKAFDRVSHSHLIAKLNKIGIRGKLHEWFCAYHREWKLQVKIGNHISTPRMCLSGVSQGGTLSPILFLIYTCDIPNFIKPDLSVSVAMFADDIKAYAVYEDGEEGVMTRRLNEAVARMCKWSFEWQIPINLNKTRIFSLNSRPLESVFPDGSPVAHCDQIKDLGVILTNNLSWRMHVREISKKGLSVVHLLFRNIYSLDVNIWLKLYKTYILPVVEYCTPVWSPHCVKDIREIES